jgi:high-affinity K+ transport system ATPase subunit B
VEQKVENVARLGATPLVVAEGSHVLGVIALKDIVKAGLKNVCPTAQNGHQNGDDHRR